MIECIRFKDHTKSVAGIVDKDEAMELQPHIGTVCGHVLNETEEAVTVGLVKWESRGDTNHEFVYVILKACILERKQWNGMLNS